MESNGHTNPDLHEEIDLVSVFYLLLARWYYFAIALVLCFFIAFVYIKLTLPEYQAFSTILIKESNSSSGKIEDIIAGEMYGEQRNLTTEIGIIKSRTVLGETIDRLNLQVTYYNLINITPRPIYRTPPIRVKKHIINSNLYGVDFNVDILNDKEFELSVNTDTKFLPDFKYKEKHEFGKPLATDNFQLLIDKVDSIIITEINNEFKFIIYKKHDLINSTNERLSVTPYDKDANIIQLHFLDYNPQKAADILNTITDVYIDKNVEDKTSIASLTLHFVDDQLNNINGVLNSIETDLQDFKKKNGTVNLSEESNQVLDRLNQVDLERLKIEIELKSLNNLSTYIKENKDVTQLAPSIIGINDPLLLQLLETFQSLQSKRKSLAFGVSDEVPSVQIIDQQISDTRISLIENLKSIKIQLETTLQALSSRIDRYEGNIKKVPEIERQLLAIQRKFEVNQNIYVYLLQKKAETSISKATAISDNKILDRAFVSPKPVSPDKKIIYLLALFASIVIPGILVFLSNVLKITVGSKEDISRYTNTPIVGIIGHKSSDLNLVVLNNPKGRITEAFRTLRTNLQFLSTDSKKVVAITSSIGSEGKSFVTLNLASILALQDYKVLIIGTDLRKPKLFDDFGLSNEIGLSSYLIGIAKIDDIILKTQNENLHLIPAGPVPPNPSELLSRTEMQTLFTELKNRYDYVIVDTPPIGIVSDPMLIAKFADINLYVVRENYSKKGYLKAIDELYRDNKLKNLSIVLNDAIIKHDPYGYESGNYYAYGNGYGYYEEEENKSIFRKLMKK